MPLADSSQSQHHTRINRLQTAMCCLLKLAPNPSGVLPGFALCKPHQSPRWLFRVCWEYCRRMQVVPCCSKLVGNERVVHLSALDAGMDILENGHCSLRSTLQELQPASLPCLILFRNSGAQPPFECEALRPCNTHP